MFEKNVLNKWKAKKTLIQRSLEKELRTQPDDKPGYMLLINIDCTMLL